MQPENLKQWRRGQGWNQEQAARVLGTTQVNISRWEAGVHPIPKTIDILTALLKEKINIRRVEHFLSQPLDR